jgi:hypothetical protein
MNQIKVGNAITDAKNGWFVGSFFDPSLGLRLSKDVEIKWGIHKAGETRQEWVTGEFRTTISILISGEWEMIFRDKTVQMKKQGDFIMWDQGVDHKWRAISDTTIVSKRWPSVKQY